MHKHYLDHLVKRDSPVHSTRPAVKSLSLVIFIVAVVLTPPGWKWVFLVYLVFILCLIAVSRIPMIYFLKRIAVAAPFIVIVVLFIPFVNRKNAGTIIFNVVSKSLLSASASIIVISTTDFFSLLKGFQSLKVPSLFIMILAFMYRYIFLIVNGFEEMERARDARCFNAKGLTKLRATANMAGHLFIRAFERGEGVYSAMCARGFDGKIRTFNDGTNCS